MEKMKKGVKLAALLFSGLLAFSAFAGCGGGGGDDGVTKIRVDLHGWTPTVSSTSTAGSIAYNSPKYIAKEFEELYDNKVKIEWVRDKDLTLDVSDVAQYFSLAIENGSCPSIAFTWGTTFQDRGWYVNLTPYLEETNDYETAPDLKGKKWKDSFEEYIWSLNGISTYMNEIVAVPLTLFAGSASGIFYNVAQLQKMGYVDSANPITPNDYEFGIGEPVNWATWMDIVEEAMSSDPKNINDLATYPYTANCWLMQFELGPAYMSHVVDFIDSNENGIVDGAELLQGVVDGYLDPVRQPYAEELLRECKRYMSKINENNLDSTKWINGTGVASYKSTVSYTPEKNNNYSFKWEMVPTPVKDDTMYTAPYVDWVSFDEAQPNVDLYLNVMKAGVTKNGKLDGEIDENKLFYSVEFLKYLTTREANSVMIDEMNTSIGAVKGVDRPMWLENSAFVKCQFAKTKSVNGWPSGFTTDYSAQMDILFSSWIKGTTSDNDFFAEWNRLQVAGARDMASKLGITLK